ncbi:MAG: phosphoesterase [Desulfobacteraceae bacterium 4572_89]|nr:MAG: phosphoesterase [Desulfobacteraceae bacterium 4572_89]
MTDKEQVLCINRDDLPPSWTQKVSVVKVTEASFFSLCRTTGFHWIARKDAETDPGYKQIIPYILLQTEDGGKTAVYRRNGNEKRLHDLWSAGIGGHINPGDEKNPEDSFETILVQGMNRELDEEMISHPGTGSLDFLGVINDESNEVGRVHLGAVFRLTTQIPGAVVPGDELTDFTWHRTRALEELNLETWSRLALKLTPSR